MTDLTPTPEQDATRTEQALFRCARCKHTFLTKQEYDRHICRVLEDDEDITPVRTGVSTVPIDLGAYKNDTDWSMK